MCSPSLLDIASATLAISVAWGVSSSLEHRWEWNIVALAPGHTEAQGLHLFLPDEFSHCSLLKLAVCPKWAHSALTGPPTALECFPEKRFLVKKEISSTEQSSPKPAIRFFVLVLLVFGGFVFFFLFL